MARQDIDNSQMRVGEAIQRDIGKKRARINQSVLDDIKIKAGDIITISNTKGNNNSNSCATVWPTDEGSDEKSSNIIRIDGQTRNNIGVAINEMVQIKSANVQQAQSISLASMDERNTQKKTNGGDKNDNPTHNSKIDDDFVEFIKGKLVGTPIMKGEEISVMILGSPKVFKVLTTQPRDSVLKVSANTLVIIQAADHTGKDAELEKRRITYEEVGGLLKEVRAMREIVELPLRHPEMFSMLGVEPHSGILLYGPPGCGKTLLARVLANESEAKMFLINGPEIVTKYYGATEANLRDIFKEAKDASPSIIFIDEIDAIAPKRDNVRGDVEKRVVAQLLALMDGLNDRGNVMVLGATNMPDSVDSALRRPGRFDREFEISVPNEEGRHEILLIHTRGMPMASDVDTKNLASELYGYTGADIKSLCREAAMKSIRRYVPEIDLASDSIPSEVLRSMQVTLADFYDAMQEIVPTAMREFYVESPTIKWQDVGGLDDLKEALTDNIVSAIKDPAKFTKMGIKPPKGALIYGPPGCGKTILGRALATETGANMILVRGPEILSKWVGESEKAIREIFRKAKASSPCIIIFDEIDSLAHHRQSYGTNSDGNNASVSETILSQLLTEIESASSRVAVIGTTSRPDVLDRSLLRTGRLDLALYASVPNKQDRFNIIKILVSKMPLADDVDLDKIASMTQNYTGADIAAICREAAVAAIKDNSDTISDAHYTHALKLVGPSVTDEINQWYNSVREGISNVDLPSRNDKTTFYR